LNGLFPALVLGLDLCLPMVADVRARQLLQLFKDSGNSNEDYPF
jgi:hypothetical protein